MSINKGPKSAFSYQNRGASKQTLGDIDGALADINEAIRIDPALPQPLTNRAIEGGAAPSSLGSGSTLGAGTLIAFATAPGKVALDGEGANSPLSATLSRHIGTPGLEVQQMLTRVRAVAATKSQQVPWSNSFAAR